MCGCGERMGDLTVTTCEPSRHVTHSTFCRPRCLLPPPAASSGARRVVAMREPHVLHTSAVVMSEHVISLHATHATHASHTHTHRTQACVNRYQNQAYTATHFHARPTPSPSQTPLEPQRIRSPAWTRSQPPDKTRACAAGCNGVTACP